uniref:Uncharacterized protein n=1 Tax=viral metagenome TaxID=1070528 RepID=A0A6C0JSW0_9ZZZZ
MLAIKEFKAKLPVIVMVQSHKSPRFTVKCPGGGELSVEPDGIVEWAKIEATYEKLKAEGFALPRRLEDSITLKEPDYTVYVVDLDRHIQDYWKIAYADQIDDSNKDSISAVVAPMFSGELDSFVSYDLGRPIRDVPNLTTLYYRSINGPAQGVVGTSNQFTSMRKSTSNRRMGHLPTSISRFDIRYLDRDILTYLHRVETVDVLRIELGICSSMEGESGWKRLKVRKLVVHGETIRHLEDLVDFSSVEVLHLLSCYGFSEEEFRLVKDIPEVRVPGNMYDTMRDAGMDHNVSTVFVQQYTPEDIAPGIKVVVETPFMGNQAQHRFEAAGTSRIQYFNYVAGLNRTIETREVFPVTLIVHENLTSLVSMGCKLYAKTAEGEPPSTVKLKVYPDGDAKPKPKSARK